VNPIVERNHPSPATPRSITGKRLSAATLTSYWGRVLARANMEFDFYLATKHFGVHHLKVTLGLSNADVAAQAGWSESSVEKMVATYAHTNVGALDRIRAGFGNVVPLHRSDANPMHHHAGSAS
jgi:hypothetical protein